MLLLIGNDIGVTTAGEATNKLVDWAMTEGVSVKTGVTLLVLVVSVNKVPFGGNTEVFAVVIVLRVAVGALVEGSRLDMFETVVDVAPGWIIYCLRCKCIR